MAVAADASGTLTPSLSTRSVADAVTNSTILVTSATAAFVSGDLGRIVTGSSYLPVPAYIATVVSGTNIDLEYTCSGSGTAQTLNLTAEYVLDNVQASGTYTLHVDTVNMQAGDILELRAYQTVLSGGTAHVAYLGRWMDAQPTDDLVKISVPVSNDLAINCALMFTLTQTAGTARAFPWKVLRYS